MGKALNRNSSWILWSRGRKKLFKVWKRLGTGVELTSVNFRCGRMGTDQNVFKKQNLDFFYRIAAEIMDELEYSTSPANVSDS